MEAQVSHPTVETHAKPPLAVQRLPVKLRNDERRVITRLFAPGPPEHLYDIIERMSGLSESEVEARLNRVLANFEGRHRNIKGTFRQNFETVAAHCGWQQELSDKCRLLLGSYFTMEYATESAALCNPSIVRCPEQTPGDDRNKLHFVMSLRATGEGHISSVVFRKGHISTSENPEETPGNREFVVDPPPPYSSTAHIAQDQYYLKDLFKRKLGEMAGNVTSAELVLNKLPDQFTFAQLQEAIHEARRSNFKPMMLDETCESMLWLARSNYQLTLEADATIADVVLFPQSQSESAGIEDLRLVRFTDDDGSITYYGTYTAHNGYRNLPMLLETKNFRRIQIHTLNGICARDKGMALFPRRIDGHYVMCSRIDGHSLYIMYSDYVHFWESAELLAGPAYPWEAMLMGNCGSPMETDAGWLLITHGVGAMRRYCISAMLLDLEDPLKIIGRLRDPLLVPIEAEREGYVPNVVYSCGALLHKNKLYLPYAMSDRATTVATVPLDSLLDKLLASPP